MKVQVLTVVPSPYQRDMFATLARQSGCELRVGYLEDAAPDSPWPKGPLAPHESVLPGLTAGRGRVRCHVNWNLPALRDTDIVIVNAPLTGLTTQQFMRRLIAGGIPWIFWGEVLRTRSGLAGWIQRALTSPLNRASAIVAIGSRALEDYGSRFPGAPLYQLPYHCDLTEFERASTCRERRSDQEPIFLFCGQMIPRKGIDVLLDAFTQAVTRGLKARLLLVGREANLPSLLANIPKVARDRIDYAGFQEPARLPEFFAKADVFVLPSRHDGWGVVVNQAMGAGLPVIATSAAGAAIDLVTPGENGFLIPPGEAEPLAEALLALGTDKQLREHMSRQARLRRASLAPSAAAASLVEILRVVLQTEAGLAS